jgi:hypothetical protein
MWVLDADVVTDGTFVRTIWDVPPGVRQGGRRTLDVGRTTDQRSMKESPWAGTE